VSYVLNKNKKKSGLRTEDCALHDAHTKSGIQPLNYSTWCQPESFMFTSNKALP